MAKESTYSTITPVLTDYIRGIDDPGGTPATANIEITDLHTLLKTSNDALYYGPKDVTYVSTNFSKAADTTLADVTGLSFTLASGGVYKFLAKLYLSCGGSGGAKVALAGTATATTINYIIRLNTTTALASEVNTAMGGDYGTTAAHVYAEVDGAIVVNAGGTLLIQFAQNASNGTASIVLVGSTFEVQKIG